MEPFCLEFCFLGVDGQDHQVEVQVGPYTTLVIDGRLGWLFYHVTDYRPAVRIDPAVYYCTMEN